MEEECDEQSPAFDYASDMDVEEEYDVVTSTSTKMTKHIYAVIKKHMSTYQNENQNHLKCGLIKFN